MHGIGGGEGGPLADPHINARPSGISGKETQKTKEVWRVLTLRSKDELPQRVGRECESLTWRVWLKGVFFKVPKVSHDLVKRREKDERRRGVCLRDITIAREVQNSFTNLGTQSGWGGNLGA